MMKVTHIPLWFWCGLVGLVLTAVYSAPITALDVSQPRLNQSAPLLREGVLTQTFTAKHNGLSNIDLRAIVYPGSVQTPTLMLTLQESSGKVLAEEVFTSVYHNQLLVLEFDPIKDSRGQTFKLGITGAPAWNLSTWSYSLDAEPSGALYYNDQLQAGDLYFSTHYTYLWGDMLADAILALKKLWQWLGALWLTLFAPGILGLKLLRVEKWLTDHWARWGLALALSLTLAALAWQWAAVIQWRWTAQILMAAYTSVGGLMTIGLIWGWWRKPCQLKFTLKDGLIFLTLVVTFLVRFWAIRDLVFPQWVDSPHHLLVVRVLAEKGYMPANYESLFPIGKFTYHFGFHVFAVMWQVLTAEAWPDVFLFGGQMLNSLFPLAVYSCAVLLTNRWRVGLLAAWVVGHVSFFPAYYVSWGRYTQLTGLLILLPLIAVTWRLVEPLQIIPKPHERLSLLALLASGLTLTHYRVLGFYAIFALVAVAAGRQHGWRWMGVAAIISGLLNLPLLWQLYVYALGPVLAAPHKLASPAGYNFFPWDYFRNPLEFGWYALAIGLALWGLWRRQRLIWCLVGWVAVTFALLNIGSGSWLVNNNSWAISLFVPASLILAVGSDDILLTTRQWLKASSYCPHPWMAKWANNLVCGALAVFIGFVGTSGLRTQITVLNPVTTLYTAADRAALEWIAQNVPQEAIFTNNAWSWQNGVWASSDGGAWLWPWLRLRSTTPPIDYTLDVEWAQQIADFNETLSKITNARSPEMLDLLRREGVTHIYIGARGGNLKPEMFVDAPEYKLLYTNGAAWVFEVVR